jgi:hypothetical protein
MRPKRCRNSPPRQRPRDSMKLEPEGLQSVTDIVDFLERVGRDAQLRSASAVELEDALIQAGLPSNLWTVDPGALEALLGARSNVCCLVYSPDKKEEEEEEEEPEEESEEEEEKDDKVKKSEDRVRRIA